jgi:hypothetical protein
MMTPNSKLYLMLHQDGNDGQLTSGPDPVAAVEAHYDEMDAWCAPSPDAGIREEFIVWLYEVPATLEESVQSRFEDLDSENFPDEIEIFHAENPGIAAVELNVVYTAADGAKASIMPRLPDLLRGVDKS